MAKGNPIPTKFEPAEEEHLKWIAQRSGLSISEVVRRAVFLLNEEVKKRGGKVGWIVEELAPPVTIERLEQAAKDFTDAKAAAAKKKQAARKHAA